MLAVGSQKIREGAQLLNWGTFWLVVATISAFIFLGDGVSALLRAWQLPEYSHGPLIPILSGLLFLRQLKEVPINDGPVHDRWVGVAVLLLALTIGTLGKLAGINDIVAYSLILWVGAVLLISFGWKVGRQFWPPVLHLVYMLPLPDVLYYKMSNYLQLISSELGVWFVRLLGVPVFLDGNIIDLGVYKLHVADACSGLRYLFPILSFSYIFAVLYRGPMWHKAILLISAVPITVFMNSVRIGIAGWVVNHYGTDWIEGFTHFFEGWVIFLACILILFALARILLIFAPQKMSLVEALDLDTDGLGTQAMRISYLRPSRALITAAVITSLAAAAWQAMPERGTTKVDRVALAQFPRTLGDWQKHGPAEILSPAVETALQADEYYSVNMRNVSHDKVVSLFMAWYDDQSQGGVHSPEICLPSAGWEIAWLVREDIGPSLGMGEGVNINRAIIQKGETRMLVYYWFEQKGKRLAWDFGAKIELLKDAIKTGRTDGGIVRLTTLIYPNETDAEAEARLNEMAKEVLTPLHNYMPGT